jgi:hypothetical protein
MRGDARRPIAGHAAEFHAHRMTARQSRPPRSRDGISVQWAVVGMTALSILAIGTISPPLLTLLHVNYSSAGGNILEKMHPGTYFAFLAFALLLLRGGDPIGELNRIAGPAKLLLIYFFACVLIVFQSVVLKRPFTGVIDTFLLPAMEPDAGAKAAAGVGRPLCALAQYRPGVLRVFLEAPPRPDHRRR